MKTAWWTPERRAAQGRRIRASWTVERRDAQAEHQREWWTSSANRIRFARAMKARWRALHPDRAVVRDRILEAVQQLTCDRCGSSASSMFVVNYPREDFVWRCRSCATEARRAYRTKGPGS